MIKKPPAKPATQQGKDRIRFGALAEPLKVQLAIFHFPDDLVEHFQADANAVTRLLIRGFCGEAAARDMRKRLVNKIGKAFQDQVAAAVGMKT